MDDAEYAMCSRCGAWVEFCQCVDRAELEKERAERAEERRAWVEYIGFLVARVRDIDRDCYGGASKKFYDDAKQKLIDLGVPEDDLP